MARIAGIDLPKSKRGVIGLTYIYGIGLSTSQVSGDDLAGFNKAGLVFGGFTNRILSNRNSLQLEIVYIQKGSRNPDIINEESENYNKPYINLSYIEIPILLKLKSFGFFKDSIANLQLFISKEIFLN